MKLLNSISEIKKRDTCVLFLRHADRNKIPDGEFGNDVELNEKGFERALNYGSQLKQYEIAEVYSSPITRSVQTAEQILKGYESQMAIEKTKLLGDPGAFVYDDKEAGEQFMKQGFKVFYEKLLNQEPIPGNYNIYEGAQYLTDFFHKIKRQNKLCVCVSHDMIIALYAFAVFNKKYQLHINWVKYLEGLIIKFE